VSLYGLTYKQIIFMATLADVLTYSRAQAQTDANGLTNANGIIFANEALLDFRRQLISAGVDASQLQEAYRDGTANVGTYLYPTDMFWLKTIELNYANSSGGDYMPATQVDVANIPGNKSFGWLRANANTQTPYFDDRGDWYEIFPTPTSAHNISQIIRIFYFLKPTEYTATSDTISYPESLDYRTLGWRIAANYLYATGATTGSGRNVHLLGDTFNLKYQERVKQLIATLSRGSQQPIQATTLQISGFEF